MDRKAERTQDACDPRKCGPGSAIAAKSLGMVLEISCRRECILKLEDVCLKFPQ